MRQLGQRALLTATLAGAAAALLGGTAGRAQEDPLRILERSRQAFYYAGGDMKAKVTMDLLSPSGQKRTRVLTMLRRNGEGKKQKYLLYFHEPGDVRRTAFLVWQYPEKDDDRWIYIPAINMVRRIAASDSRSSFVGSDFTYEDVSGRDLAADTHVLLRQEPLDGAECHVVESRPQGAAEYTRKVSWIDTATFLPRREEYYDAQNELARRFTAERVEDIGGHPTIVHRTMENVKSGHRTEVTFTEVAYDVGLDDGVFTERALQSPPPRWVR
ncbi:MAG: outer membrane lipoprotein-sorting protein [Candidatus Latescibacterota bacterium]